MDPGFSGIIADVRHIPAWRIRTATVDTSPGALAADGVVRLARPAASREETTMRTCYCLVWTFLLLMVVSAGALAQTPPVNPSYDVFVADASTGYVWGFRDTLGTALNLTDPFGDVSGLALTQDFKVLVSDYLSGISLLDPDTLGVSIVDPYGYSAVDVYPDGDTDDIFYITGVGYSELYVLLEGSAPAEFVTGFSGEPVDLQIAPLGANQGNLYVLLRPDSGSPTLQEYERTGPTTVSYVGPVVTSAPDGVYNFALRPDGSIVLLDGTDGMYDVGPSGALTQFGPTGSGTWEKIDIAADGTIYVTDGELGLIHRFEPDGTPILPVIDTISQPTAVAAPGFTPSVPGSTVVVNPIPEVEITFEEVTGGGYTTAYTTESMSRTSPGGNTLPAYAVSPAGRDDYTYVTLSSSADYENLVQVDIFLPGTRFFYAYGSGSEFVDVTVEGSIEDARGTIPRFTALEPPTPRNGAVAEAVLVEDTRTLSVVIGDKFDRLYEMVEGGDPGSPSNTPDLDYVRSILIEYVDRAWKLYNTSQAPSAIDELLDLNDQIRYYAGSAIPNSPDEPEGNVAGEMLSRSKTLIFSLSQLFLAPEDATGVVSEPGTLSLAFPSPVRGVCRFELSGPVGSPVTARVYDVSGRVVATLFEGRLDRSSMTIHWNGTSDGGRRVASGVYLTRVSTPDTSVTGKVVFIR
ncbi:MAG: T9SS type A sorting domain-containing protein [Candidatus Eisenbacteria bacterium]|nr:T9SS type A sorting domain-containing protein [Candidatus Eisenbacteria bacterium]